MGAYCVRCGRDVDGGDHGECVVRLALEPPRFCPDCGRRMTVQVTPLSWTTRCVEHGTRTP